MQTRLRFKIIFVLIVLSLVGLVASQAYWLHALYEKEWETTHREIMEAMRLADYKEVFLRLDEIRKRSNELNGTQTYARSWRIEAPGDNNPDGKKTELPADLEQYKGMFMRYEMNESDTAKTSVTEALDSYLFAMSQLEIYMNEALHRDLDSVQMINYPLYEASLHEELLSKGITEPYILQVLRTDNPDTIIGTNITNARIYEKVRSGTSYFDRQVKSVEDITFRLYLQSPYRMVLRHMAGIFLSSLILIILVIIAFVYLLLTILRQKTVEELKTDFTNNVTHELKTPIAVAYAANDALLNYDSSLTTKQKKYLGIIGEQLESLTGMVEQILTLAVENRSTVSLNPGPIRITEMMPALIEQQKLKTKKKVIFRTDIPDDFTLTADRTHLYNMLGNLIDNALKYSVNEPVEIEIKAGNKEGESYISVHDNGVGIPEEHQQQVFGKFFRVPQGNLHTVKGYGLGLYCIRDMMNRHGGFVTLESKPGVGSVFTLHFKQENHG